MAKMQKQKLLSVTVCLLLLFCLSSYLIDKFKHGSDFNGFLRILNLPSPSDVPLNLKEPHRRFFSQYTQDQFVAKLLKNKKGGFFIEAGALDGEYTSNTIYLERELGWSGLLVEPSPLSYGRLLSKNRKAYTVNACLSPENYFSELMFIEEVNYAIGSRLEGSPVKIDKKKGPIKNNISVPCFPVYTMLQALGNPRVDYFSLDVEGFEVKVLKTIPWDKVDIVVFTVETYHLNEGREVVIDYLEANGFKFIKHMNLDDIFYNTKYEHELNMNVIKEKLHN